MEDNKSWITTDQKFVNPYNFVGLGGEVERVDPEKGNLTGKIACTLTTKTPLCIPDAETKRLSPGSSDHYIYDFYRVGGIPTIAGSQLKGMVRTYYEAFSNSCLSVNNNNIMSARHTSPRCPGLLKYDKNGWHLYPANKSKAKTYPEDNPDGYKRVWYDINGKSKKYFIFKVSGEEIECANLKDAINDYNENIEFYKANEGSFKKYEAELTYKLKADPSSKEMYPVFYEMISDNFGKTLVYLSPSQIGRSVFSKRIDNILGSHCSCSKTNGDRLCKACSLFGMISLEKNGRSKASSLRFSDAKADTDTFSSNKNVTLKELASPKTTSVEFYTRRPKNAKAWTYESKTTGYIKEKHGTRSQTVPERELCDVELNGRKFYIHNPNLSEQDYRTDEKNKRNNSMEICKVGAKFNFDVYFENISELQLKELVWTLTLGENSVDSDRMFKLGHGKPLGLGSVKVTINSVESREFDHENLIYNVKKIELPELLSDVPFDTDNDAYKAFISVIDFKTAENACKNGAKISYPIADDKKGTKNSKASHQWFIANRSLGKGGTSTAWSLKYVLPMITDDDLTLPAFEKSGEKPVIQQRERKKRNNSDSGAYKSPNNGWGGLLSIARVKEKKK